MDDRLRALAKDVDVLCDQFFEAGFTAGLLCAAWHAAEEQPFDDVEAAMHEARSEYWASLQGRFGALLEDA